MFALNVANNCDQEAQSDAQQKMRYEKCEIMYGEADYFQKNILLTQFFSKNTRNGIAEVVILDEWDNMTIDNACKTLCMSHYIIYMRNLKEIFIRIQAAVNGRHEQQWNEANIQQIIKYIKNIIGTRKALFIDLVSIKLKLGDLLCKRR